jgi:hypothetical protein
MYERVEVMSQGNIRVRESSKSGRRGGSEGMSVLVEDEGRIYERLGRW